MEPRFPTTDTAIGTQNDGMHTSDCSDADAYPFVKSQCRCKLITMQNRTAIFLIVMTTTFFVTGAAVLANDDQAKRDVAKPSKEPVVMKAIALMQKSVKTYTTERDCYSCHHQSLPVMAFAMAKQRGFKLEPKAMSRQSQFTVEFFKEREERLPNGKGVPGGPFTAGYALVGLHADDWPGDSTTASLVAFLRKTQEKDGRWRIRNKRPPLEESDFTATALAVRGLQIYSGKDEESVDATKRARSWLERTTPKNNEGRAFQLLGLWWSQASRDVIVNATSELLKKQQPDGGWRQTATGTSDAYATGQALFALHQAGEVATKHIAYRKGIAYLRMIQQSDGSWLVKTRSKPIQKYFESGFPHGKNQFISISGTAWATMALLLTLDEDTTEP